MGPDTKLLLLLLGLAALLYLATWLIAGSPFERTTFPLGAVPAGEGRSLWQKA